MDVSPCNSLLDLWFVALVLSKTLKGSSEGKGINEELKGRQFLPAFIILFGEIKKTLHLPGGVLSGTFSGYSKTPMEKAIRICIDEAVKLIEAKTPKQYYRAPADSQPSDESITTSQPQAAPVPPRTISPSQRSSSDAEAQAQALPVELPLEKFVKRENDLLKGELI